MLKNINYLLNCDQNASFLHLSPNPAIMLKTKH